MASHGEKVHLRPAMGFADLLLFFIMTGFSIRWIAAAAAAGPSSIVIWAVALAAFYIPLVFCVLELSSRYPDEGGLYVWSKHAFGEFAGFITGWTYWSSNLVYFPGILYFAAGNALFIGGSRWQDLSSNRSYFVLCSLIGLGLATVLNIVGLDIGKWLHNVGAVCLWVPALTLIIMGGVAWDRFGSATDFSLAHLWPSTHWKDIAFWSTIAFALAGVESASVMGEEIKDARRNIPRALLIAGTIITLTYMLGTICLLLALPRSEISGLQGIMQAIAKAADRVGLNSATPIAALLITISGLGTVGAWLAAVARLPFVAGVDRFLPAAFGRLHPKWGTPHVALWTQSSVAALFVLLGQAGTNVKGAYDVLVSMGVITYLIPFLFIFGAMIKLQKEPAGPEVMLVPGGKVVAVSLSLLGFTATTVAIVLALIPSEDEPNQRFAVAKVITLTLILVFIGVGLYVRGKWKRSQDPVMSEAHENVRNEVRR
jgi:amino acid transporter